MDKYSLYKIQNLWEIVQFTTKGGFLVKRKISMTIDEDIYSTFKEYCKENGMKVSSKVELLMKGSTQNDSLKKFIQFIFTVKRGAQKAQMR